MIDAGNSANVSPFLHSLYVSLLRSDVLDEHTLTGLRENDTVLVLFLFECSITVFRIFLSSSGRRRWSRGEEDADRLAGGRLLGDAARSHDARPHAATAVRASRVRLSLNTFHMTVYRGSVRLATGLG